MVIELLMLHDVEAAVGQEGGDGPDDAGPFGAGQGEDELRRAGFGRRGLSSGLGRCGWNAAGGAAIKNCGHDFLLLRGDSVGRGAGFGVAVCGIAGAAGG